MSFEKKLEKYAKIAFTTGLNVQKGQLVLIDANVEHVEYVRKLVEAAYNAGAGEVIVNWSDPICGKLTLVHGNEKDLMRCPSWQVSKIRDYQRRGCACLHILSPNPKLMEDVDSGKINRIEKAHTKHLKGKEDIMNYTAKNLGQWGVISIPNPEWAQMVYPKCSEENAMKKLWDDIFTMNRITDKNDPVKEWKKHTDEILEHGKKLTKYQFKELRFKNSLGTDITVGLVRNHIWHGGVEYTPAGVGFVPNLPTEEIFCMPHSKKVDGIVYASKPLCIQGKVVKDFWFKFKKGEVVDYGASENYESLKNFVETDEGSKRLGEIALLSYDSPISNLGKIFFNALIDENASCHMALGMSFAYNIKGGNDMTREQLNKLGSNFSHVHLDFMFGTKDMSVIGIDQKGKEVTVFRNGNFVF